MRIATWNVNDVRKRMPLLLDWLAETKPDVVGLQETRVTTERFPASALAAAGYGCMNAGQRTWNGVALLARGVDPVPIRRALPGDDRDEQARYVEAAIDGIIFGCLYLPNGNPQPGPKFDYKLRWFDRLLAHAGALIDTGLPAALIGDFNVVPEDRDIYASRSWHDNALVQPEPREAYRRLLAQGWTDAIRAVHPGKSVYTFWDYRRNRWERDAGLRIDHLLLAPALAPLLVDAGVDRRYRAAEGASDHGPVWIELSDAKLA